jgi:class 3 adenylate cyclase
VRGRLRALDWVLIALLSGSFAWMLIGEVDDAVREGRGRVTVRISPAAGRDAYPTVRAVPAGASGLEPGDELHAVAGADLRGRNALFFYDKLQRAVRSDGAATVRGRRAGKAFEARILPTSWRFRWVGWVFATSLLGTALLVWILAPHWHLARRYALACWCFAVIAGFGLASPLDALRSLVIYPLGVALTIWNAAEVTLSARPVPRALRIAALAAGALALAFLLSAFVLPFPGFARVAGPVLALVFPGATLVAITRAYRRSTPVERRQLRWVLLGFYLAMPGFAASLVFPSTTTALLAPLLGLGIPLGIVVSVIGYRFLDVDPVISAVASYTVVGLAVLGGALALVPRAAAATSAAVGVDPAASQWLLTMGLLGAAVPVHRYLRPRIDRRLFAARHARMLGFERLLDEIGRCATVEELTRLPGERLDALLEPESIAIYAREETVFTPIFVRGANAPPAFDADSLLVKTLERRQLPLWADAPELDAFDRAALDTLGVAVVGPTRRGDTLVAFSCLGRKRSGDIYTPEELAFMTAIANRCSEVLVKLDDEVVLREARELQRSLRRYVPGAVAEEIAEGRELAAEEREVTVLFVDLRGYTGLAERRAAAEVFSTLNAYTETVSELVRARGGTIVEFHGDGLMAVFGAPKPLEAKERAAVEAARDVIGAFAGRLEMGVGVATGPAFVGNLRTADRLIWSAIGNTTNLAARLQSLTRELDAAIAIDAATEVRAGYVCADFEAHPGVAIRGRSERVDVFALSLARLRSRVPGGAAEPGSRS